MRLQYSVAVGGTHGKTTTTSMVAAMLDAGGLDPTVVNGGIINAYGANAKVGEGDWIVVEADESDGTFLRLRSTVAVVTNIDPEHLDHYGDFDAVKRAFQDFVESIPFYGFAAVCIDHPEVQEMAARVENRRLVTYGVNPQAEVRAMNIGIGAEGSTFDVLISAPDGGATTVLGDITLPMAGEHNVLNALAAIAVGRELGAPEKAIRKGLAGFGGVRAPLHPHRRGARRAGDRRLRPPSGGDRQRAEGGARGHQRAGDRGGAAAPLHAAAATCSQEFCRCFNDADVVIVADVYPAGEAPIEGADRDALVEGLQPLRPPPRAGAGEPGRAAGADRRGGAGRATWWSAWAPATSPPGPTPCRPSSRRWQAAE